MIVVVLASCLTAAGLEVEDCRRGAVYLGCVVGELARVHFVINTPFSFGGWIYSGILVDSPHCTSKHFLPTKLQSPPFSPITISPFYYSHSTVSNETHVPNKCCSDANKRSIKNLSTEVVM